MGDTVAVAIFVVAWALLLIGGLAVVGALFAFIGWLIQIFRKRG